MARYRSRLTTIFVLAALAGLVIYSTPTAADGVALDAAQEPARSMVAQTSSPRDLAPPEPLKLAVGDKLKILFYERLGDAGE